MQYFVVLGRLSTLLDADTLQQGPNVDAATPCVIRDQGRQPFALHTEMQHITLRDVAALLQHWLERSTSHTFAPLLPHCVSTGCLLVLGATTAPSLGCHTIGRQCISSRSFSRRHMDAPNSRTSPFVRSAKGNLMSCSCRCAVSGR